MLVRSRHTEDLIKETILVQASLPLAMSFDRVQQPLSRQGKETGYLDWPEGGHQRIEGTSHDVFFRKIGLCFHRRSSFSQNAAGVPHQTPGLIRRH